MRRSINVNRQPDTRFITEWVVTAGQTITLPTVSGYSYAAAVDWGDGTSGTVTAYNVGNTHTYTNVGTYQIKIKGTFEAWSFANSGSRLSIKKVLSWGNPKFKYFKKVFTVVLI